VAKFLKKSAELSANSPDNSVNSTEFRIPKILLILSHVNCISTKFFWFLMIFSEFFKKRRNRWEVIFHRPPNFVTLVVPQETMSKTKTAGRKMNAFDTWIENPKLEHRSKLSRKIMAPHTTKGNNTEREKPTRRTKLWPKR
jgi:hypothetical protein